MASFLIFLAVTYWWWSW